MYLVNYLISRRKYSKSVSLSIRLEIKNQLAYFSNDKLAELDFFMDLFTEFVGLKFF